MRRLAYTSKPFSSIFLSLRVCGDENRKQRPTLGRRKYNLSVLFTNADMLSTQSEKEAQLVFEAFADNNLLNMMEQFQSFP